MQGFFSSPGIFIVQLLAMIIPFFVVGHEVGTDGNQDAALIYQRSTNGTTEGF
jgi:hypothetical protein